MSSSAVTSPILTDTRIRPRLKHHHSEGSIGGSQLTRRTDVQVGQDDGGGTVPAGVWTIVISGNISIIIRSLVLSGVKEKRDKQRIQGTISVDYYSQGDEESPHVLVHVIDQVHRTKVSAIKLLHVQLHRSRRWGTGTGRDRACYYHWTGVIGWA